MSPQDILLTVLLSGIVGLFIYVNFIHSKKNNKSK